MRMRNFTSVVRGTCHVFEKFSCLTLTGVSFNLDAENNYGNLSSILKMPSACWFKTLFSLLSIAIGRGTWIQFENVCRRNKSVDEHSRDCGLLLAVLTPSLTVHWPKLIAAM